MEKKILERLQKYELEMMVELDEYLKSNDIKYSLYAGTALGAVRHHGFIPWDDDIDILMTRNEYNKLLKVWKKKKLDGYEMQDINTDDNCSVNHTKIRKIGTRMCTYEYELELKMQGIWIDIFIFDKVKDTLFSNLYINYWVYKRLLLSRASAPKKIDDTKCKKILKKIFGIIPQKKRIEMIKKSEIKISKYKDYDGNYYLKDFSTPSMFKIKYPKELFETYKEISFENHDFLILSNADLFLKLTFGDYMKLPPKEEQVCKHNPIILEFEIGNNVMEGKNDKKNN